MEIKLNDALNIFSVIKDIIDNKKYDLSTTCQFRLLGIMKALEPNVVNFETIRNQKIQEYGKSDDEGNISIAKDDIDAINNFSKDISNLLNESVIVNTDKKIKADEIIEKEIDTTTLMLLYPFIEE